MSDKIKKESGVFGINIDSIEGNITIGFNGTIVIFTPETGPIFIYLEDTEDVIGANFGSIIGENIAVPINFEPLKLVTTEVNISEIHNVALVLTPIAKLKGNVSLSALVNDQELIWQTGDEVYFEDVDVFKNESSYNTEITDVKLIFENMSLTVDSINTTVIVHSLIGPIIYNTLIDLTSIELIEGQKMAGELLVFLLDTLFNVENQTFYLSIEKAGFPFITVFLLLIPLSVDSYWRRKKKLS